MAMRRPRTRRRACGVSRSRSTAPPGSSGEASRTLPAVTRPGGGTRPSTARAVMLLPDPDSPTSPTISPRPTASVAPRTTATQPAGALRAGKETSRWWISSSGGAVTAWAVLSGELAQPADRGGDAETGGSRAGAAVIGFDVGHAGDVEVGPAPHVAGELRQEGRRGA